MKKPRFKRPSRFLLKLSFILFFIFLTYGGIIGTWMYSIYYLQDSVRAIGHIRDGHDRLYKITTLAERHFYEGDTARAFTRKEIYQEEEAVRKLVYGLRDGDEALGLRGVKPPKTPDLPDYTEEWWLWNRYVSSYLNTVKLSLGDVMRATPGEEGYLVLMRFRDNIDRFSSHMRDMGGSLQKKSIRNFARFNLVQFACLGAGIVVIGATSYLIVAFVYIPIKKTSRGMEMIRRGEWGYQIPVSSRDEVGQMAQGFNQMAGELTLKTQNLKDTLADLSEREDALSNIGLFLRVIEPETHRVHFQNKPMANFFPHGLEQPCYAFWQRKEVCEFCVCQEAIKTQRPQKKEMESPGGLIYMVYAFPMFNPDGTVTRTIEIAEDITQERQRQKELEDTRLQLFQAEKLAAVGQMAGGIAHSINNPLSGITLYSDILLKKIESLKEGPNLEVSPSAVSSGPNHGANLYEDLKKGLTLMKESATRCETVVKDLLKISRKPRAEMVPTQVNGAVEYCLGTVEPQMRPKRIKLVKNLSGDLPEVLGSHTELETVFISLLSNALDATAGGNTITVESYRKDHWVVVTIADTGHGISKDDLPYIFNPYFTTKPPGKGTGLGLSTSLLIVQAHRGTVDVKSRVGKGTVVTVSLPVHESE